MMKDTSISLTGLFFRDGDRESPPGACRVLHNLYPSGTRPRLVWNPTRQCKEFYRHTPSGNPAPIKSAIAWQRNNLPPVLVFLSHFAPPGPDDDYVYMASLDSSGNVIAGTEVPIYNGLGDHDESRDARFTQVGDHLIIAITREGKPENLLIASTYENETICFPYNMPFVPEVTIPTADIDPPEGHPFFGFRFGFEMYDGTVTRVTGVTFRQLDVTTPGGTTVKFTSDALAPDATYEKVIKGIAVFVSQPQPDVSGVVSKALWYKVGMLTWEKTADGADLTLRHRFEFTLKDTEAEPLLVTLAEFPQSDEDNLTSHGLYAQVLGSYNKKLLLGAAEREFAYPVIALQPAGTPTLWAKPQSLVAAYDPILTDPVYKIHLDIGLTWTNPGDARLSQIVLEQFFTARWEYELPVVGWTAQEFHMDWTNIALPVATPEAFSIDSFSFPVEPKYPNPAAGPYNSRLITAYLQYRLFARYSNGQVSAPAYFTPYTYP